MRKLHQYAVGIEWTGNLGEGTSHYRSYTRNYTIFTSGKPPILASSDPAFRGDGSRYNPEEQLVSALAGCHMLWYLHLCADAGVQVTAYMDRAEGEMEEQKDGSGRFRSVTLHPQVTVAEHHMIATARELHARAHAMCFIANSVNFPVNHRTVVIAEKEAGE